MSALLETGLAASLVHVLCGKKADAEIVWSRAALGTAAERRAYEVMVGAREQYIAALERYFALCELRFGRKPLRGAA